MKHKGVLLVGTFLFVLNLEPKSTADAVGDLKLNYYSIHLEPIVLSGQTIKISFYKLENALQILLFNQIKVEMDALLKR